jgi:predicted permease
MSSWLRRVWHLINRPRFERELAREMREHREMMHDPSKFGDTHRMLERSRDAWGWNWLDEASQDLAVGVRTLLKSPSFAITATLILSFGIGLNVTLYQMLQTALLRPPAMKASEQVARFLRFEKHGSSTAVPYPVADFVKENNTVLSAVMVEAASNIAWGADASEQIEGSFVSTNWFDELGYGPLHGRVLSDALDANAAAPSIVVSYAFWKSRLGGDPNIVGTTAYLDRKPVTVVGVAPKGLPGLDYDTPDVYVPIVQREYFYPQSAFLHAWNSDAVAMYGRFRPGVSRAAVREELRSTMQAIAAGHSDVKKDQWLEPLMATENFMRPRERREIFTIASLIAGLTSLVLIVAAANLGNLVMSRATGRVRELGVRMALGARRGRIVRQLVVESLPIVALGTLGSLAFASLVSTLIASLVAMPPYLDFSIEWRTIVVAIALSSLALLVVGILPAWKVAQQHLIDAIKDGGQHVSRALDRALVRRVMVAAQVAGSCLLLIVAGMMARSVQRVLQTDLGFDYERAAVLEMPLGRYGVTGDQARAYWYAVKERVKAHPEVEEAAIVTAPPLGGRVFETGYDDLPGVKVFSQSVDPEYLAMMRIPLVSGRIFGHGDERTLVISRRLALEMYGTLDVLGRAFPSSADKGRSTALDVAKLAPPEGTIVGIAADAHSMKVNATDAAELYRPLEPADFSLVYLVARARSNADRLPPILREAAGLDPRVIPTAHAMHEDFDHRTRGPRIASAISAGIGVLTLALACLGIFGVVSYGVALRTKEIGIRIALGATRPSLLRVIVRQVLAPVGAGLVLGLIAAIPTGIALSKEPFYLQNVDPVAFLAALTIFAVAGALAALAPALATLRNNPIDALRHQ